MYRECESNTARDSNTVNPHIKAPSGGGGGGLIYFRYAKGGLDRDGGLN